MKKLMTIFCLCFLCGLTDKAYAKVNYPLSYEAEEQKPNLCFVKSNYSYNDCMRTCISPSSPLEIIDLCWRKCARSANNEFFNCLLRG